MMFFKLDKVLSAEPLVLLPSPPPEAIKLLLPWNETDSKGIHKNTILEGASWPTKCRPLHAQATVGRNF